MKSLTRGCMTLLVLAFAGPLLAADTGTGAPGGAERLLPLPNPPLPLGSVKPTGWLRRQLEVQAAGLGGHLDEFWPDVADSSWIGGKAEGWERGPYWLDGFIPLAVHLDDPKLKARARRWADHILQSQDADGWLGPKKGNPDPNSRLSQYDVWPRFIVLKALTQWQEATGDGRVVPAMTKFLRLLDKVLDERPLDEWARVRWADLVVSIHWLHDRTGEPWLLDLAAKVRKQGLDWPALARDFPYREKVTHAQLKGYQAAAGGKWINDQFGATHGVNVGMGVKAPGVWFRQSQDPADRDAVFRLLDSLDRHHGQATGVFSCDEHLAGRHPSQGTELCTVVELMYSLETLLTIVPDVRLADRLESVAFNALPATFSDDMWAHQYDQQANQVVCKVSPERVYTNNGPEANLFGLEPNFGCCLANMHQGWPKLATHLWTRNAAGGLTAMVYAPCEIDTKVGDAVVRVTVKTDYPLTTGDTVSIEVTTDRPVKFPLELRIPSWAAGAKVSHGGGEAVPAAPGTFHRVEREWAGRQRIDLSLPQVTRVERRTNGSVTVRRGPIVYALRVPEDWRKLRDRGPTADWEVHPKGPWNYALDLDPGRADEQLVVRAQKSDPPFSSTTPPITLLGRARRVPGWELLKNAADAPPPSPVAAAGPPEQVELVPYGCAKLRVTEIPVLAAEPVK